MTEPHVIVFSLLCLPRLSYRGKRFVIREKQDQLLPFKSCGEQGIIANPVCLDLPGVGNELPLRHAVEGIGVFPLFTLDVFK